jgi:hypothetical protein
MLKLLRKSVFWELRALVFFALWRRLKSPGDVRFELVPQTKPYFELTFLSVPKPDSLRRL